MKKFIIIAVPFVVIVCIITAILISVNGGLSVIGSGSETEQKTERVVELSEEDKKIQALMDEYIDLNEITNVDTKDKSNEEIEEEISLLQKKLSEYQDMAFKTPDDEIMETKLQEVIAQLQIANGTFEYDYKEGFLMVLNTVDCVQQDYQLEYERGDDDPDRLEFLKYTCKRFKTFVDKYKNIVENESESTDYKELYDQFMEEDDAVCKEIHEKYPEYY